MMVDLVALKASYDLRAPIAARYCARLAEQVGEIINSNNISLAVPIETRVKTWQSLSEKIERQKLQIYDVAKIGDLVGIRIILLFKRDLEKVISSLSSSLSIVSSEDAFERLGVEMFGYQSVHLQTELPGSWREVSTFRDFSDLQAEIQVRTAAQHIWAAASHKLQYKMEASVPKQVLRSVNRVAALLETVDLEFERALVERENYVERAGISLLAGDAAIKSELLNVDLLEKVLDQQLPLANKSREEDYEDLLKDLSRAKIALVDDLVRFIRAREANALREDKRIIDAFRRTGTAEDNNLIEVTIDGMAHVAERDRIDRGVFYDHAGLVRTMLLEAGLFDPDNVDDDQ
jgi:putative GTP pyrophosphokinase